MPEFGNFIFALSHSFLACWRYLRAKKQHKLSIGEDQFYRNT
jgi:hypothetical protein